MVCDLNGTAASLLPYATIEAAASGSVDAINAVLKHYERYIAALAARTLYDGNGVPHLYLDEETIFYKGIMPSETGFRFSSGL